MTGMRKPDWKVGYGFKTDDGRTIQMNDRIRAANIEEVRHVLAAGHGVTTDRIDVHRAEREGDRS